MLTAALYLVLAVAVGGVLFFLSVAIFGGSTPQTQPRAMPGEAILAPAAALEPLPERSDLVTVTADTIPLALPDGRTMSATDVDALRLPVALRGYRMAETDVALDRLARELTQRDEQIEALTAQLARHGDPDEPVREIAAPALDPAFEQDSRV
jgi:DivIVA domain-containing protein